MIVYSTFTVAGLDQYLGLQRTANNDESSQIVYQLLFVQNVEELASN